MEERRVVREKRELNLEDQPRCDSTGNLNMISFSSGGT